MGARRAESLDLYALRVGVDIVPVTLVATEFEETSPAVSPDGRWLAYVSDESGQYPDRPGSHRCDAGAAALANQTLET